VKGNFAKYLHPRLDRLEDFGEDVVATGKFCSFGEVAWDFELIVMTVPKVKMFPILPDYYQSAIGAIFGI
jgi:hypothetical protein